MREYTFSLNSATYTKIVEAESRCVVYLKQPQKQAMGVYSFGINIQTSHFTFTHNTNDILLDIDSYDIACPHNVRYVSAFVVSVELETGECLYSKNGAKNALTVIIFDKEV